MRKFGVKVWSKDVLRNEYFFQQCIDSVKEGKFSYIELFAQAGSYSDTAEKIKAQMKGLEVVIHAPHCGVGVDLGNADMREKNREMLKDSQLFADMLDAQIIILHPGVGQGQKYLEESIHQFRSYHDARLAVENQPYECNATHRLLHGITPNEIKLIKDETQCQFCFDFYHAICAANSLQTSVYDYLAEFHLLKPDMYHLCDGDIASTEDTHLHLGKGNFDLARFLREYIDDGAKVTLETGLEVPQNINPWMEDLDYIQKVEKNL